MKVIKCDRCGKEEGVKCYSINIAAESLGVLGQLQQYPQTAFTFDACHQCVDAIKSFIIKPPIANV